MTSLRVATYNIHKGVLNDLFGLRRVATIHSLRQRLHELDADLVFLQEVLGRNDRHARRFEHWPEETQAAFLARAPGVKKSFESAYGKNAHYLHGDHGNALLSRFEILRRENRDISDHALEKRGILHCVVSIEGREVHCFVVHLGLFAGSRTRQVEALVHWIEKELPPQAPLLIAGDFNDWGHKLSQGLYDRLQVREVFDEVPSAFSPAFDKAKRVREKVLSMAQGTAAQGLASRLPLPNGIRAGRTFPSLLPWLKMDRIYHRGFQVTSATVLRGPSWAQLSDHSPVIAELKLLPLQ
jgi:endonuclease/exonuclease/phosphatase family metal-dependent hydrolase